MINESRLFWYRTHQNIKCDKLVFTHGQTFIGFYTEQSDEQIDKLNLTEIGFGTLEAVERSIEDENY